MPRASAGRRQQGAATPNAHNGRHENGLVAPGKRVQKQKSNGHLNANARNHPDRPSQSTPPLPATPPRSNGAARTVSDSAVDPKMLSSDPVRRQSVGDSESSSSESFHHAQQVNLENHRRIDVNAAKNPAVHRDAGPLSMALTVLRACPLYDTIAILIVLLQLPPTFLSIIHLLYTALTCVSPMSVNSAFSFADIFEGSLSAPSLATVVVVDMLVLLVWAFLWKPLQDLALDLAQIVIALALGGGTSSRETAMKNIMLCFGVIGVHNFTRHGIPRSGGLSMFLSPSAGAGDSEDPLEPMQEIGRKGTQGLFRSVIAIHILTQGVVRCIRDWYVRREKQDTRLSGLGDPEAAKGAIGNASTDSTGVTVRLNEPDVSTTSNDRALSAKKKRKQSAQVRTRQPLWAALASSKIVMFKEYESSSTLLESAGANATDVHNLGNAPFDTEADRIWITYIGFDEICFSTSYFPNHQDITETDNTPGIDRSKPFFVRVNKTAWQPTRLNLVDPNTPSGKDARWCGEIYGLAPMSNYECEFVQTSDGKVLFATSVRTLQAPVADISSNVALPLLSQASAHTLRPGSPISTLKTSIATAETKLNEERSRQKRERKEQKSKLNATKKEIEKLSGSISSSGGNDDRLRQKVQQSNLHMKQAEEAVLNMVKELEVLEAMPDDDVQEWTKAKKAFQSQKDIHNDRHEEHIKSKQELSQQVQSLTNDVSTLQQKRERMQARIAKLNGEHERITDANARGVDEAQRKENERAHKREERAKNESSYLAQIESLQPQLQNLQTTLSAIWANIQSIHYPYMQQQMQASPTTNGPSYDLPEGTIPNSMDSPWISHAVPVGSAMNPHAPGFLSPSSISSPVPHAAQVAGASNRTRGRSSSMLSNVSGFTQSSGEERQSSRWHDAFQQLHPRDGQGKSDGDSSTGGSSSGPRSPIVGNASLGLGSAALLENGSTPALPNVLGQSQGAGSGASISRWAGQWEDQS